MDSFTPTAAEDVSQMSYPDFVAFLGQKNMPPGGEQTIQSWIERGGIDDASHVLDLACTTGYSSRRTAQLTGCSAVGIDISANAVRGAVSECDRSSGSLRLKYLVADASELPFLDEQFTHILAGCNFSFIQKRATAVSECYRTLRRGGILCVANFYYIRKPSIATLDEVERVVGFRPEADWTASFWELLFSPAFRLTWESHRDLPMLSDDDVVASVAYHIFEENEVMRSQSQLVRDLCFHRLLDTRLVLNRHRADQRIAIQTWERK